MKKIICAALCALLVMINVCALGDAQVTAESLLSGNGLASVLATGVYTHEHIDFYDGEGNVRDYNDITYKRGETGYTMLLTYPENGDAAAGGMLVRGNYYVQIENDSPTYMLYAMPSYADAGDEMAISSEAYIAYPALNSGLKLTTADNGDYVVTAQISADKCDQDVVAAHGHDATSSDTVFDEYTYAADTGRLKSETMYYMRGDAKRICENVTFEYDADGADYEKYASSAAADARTISVVLNPAGGDRVEIKYNITNQGAINFVLASGTKLYSDEACTQEVAAQGDNASFAQDTYYATAG